MARIHFRVRAKPPCGVFAWLRGVHSRLEIGQRAEVLCYDKAYPEKTASSNVYRRRAAGNCVSEHDMNAMKNRPSALS